MWKLTIPGHMENERWIPERDTELRKLIQFVRAIITPLIMAAKEINRVAKSIGLSFATLVVLVYAGALVSRGGSDVAVRQSIYAVMLCFILVMGVILIYRFRDITHPFNFNTLLVFVWTLYIYAVIVPGWQPREDEAYGWYMKYISENETMGFFYFGFLVYFVYLCACYHELESQRLYYARRQQQQEEMEKWFALPEPYKPSAGERITKKHLRNNHRAMQIYGKPFEQLTSDQKEKLKK
ncbi:MAG: hypothetical protein O8C63_08725 [Candidatus Methanoperedens sp.]|nr:hypothetical protein [Candidatus Methanoperedens sp.]